MRGLSKSVPKYRKHRASGQAVVTIGGRGHYLGPHNSETSIAAYDRIVAECLAAGRDHTRMPGFEEHISVATLCLAFFEDEAKPRYQKNGKPTSELTAYLQVIRTLSRLYGDHQPNDFRPLALKAVRKVSVDQGLARKSVNHNVRRVCRIWRWGVSEEMVETTVWQALTAVEGLRRGHTTAPEPTPVMLVSMQDVLATIERLSEPRRLHCIALTPVQQPDLGRARWWKCRQGQSTR